ncbi:hypothetical protein OA005_01115 [Paracoccaceae bacterium]|nr:hypothetical protein [Paracoccaceae bacterium]
MIRILIFLVVVLFLAWALHPFIKKRIVKKEDKELKRIIEANKIRGFKMNTITLIFLVILLIFVVAIALPKLGINFLTLFQKIIPIMSVLRGVLPF